MRNETCLEFISSFVSEDLMSIGFYRLFRTVLGISLLSVTSLMAQQENYSRRPMFTIEEIGNVSRDLPITPHVEPVIAVHPEDPMKIAVASIVVKEPTSDDWTDSWVVEVHLSSDGGKTWKRRALPGVISSADPWLVWDKDGLALSYLATVPRAGGKKETKIMLFLSSDNGLTWDVPVSVFPPGEFYDHPVISKVGNSLFVFATGPTTGAISISVMDLKSREVRHLPAFHPDGNNNNLGSGIAISDSVFVFSFYSMSGSFPTPLTAVYSRNNGRTYHPSTITQRHIPVGFPMMSVDRSDGKFRNRIYAVWVHSEQDPSVMISFSGDSGATWSVPQRVHRDSTHLLRARPVVGVNRNGHVAVSWTDGRHHESGYCWDVYTSVSTDGGTTFSEEVRLTGTTTCPSTEANGGAGTRWRWGGDYTGLTGTGNDAFLVVWSDTRTGVYQNWVTRLGITNPHSGKRGIGE